MNFKKFILRILNENKKGVIIISAIATIGSLLSVAIPYIYGRLFDLAIIKSTTITLLLSLILVWLVASLISNFTQSKTSYLGEILSSKVGLREEAKVYGQFLGLSASFHKNKKTGEVLEKIARGSWHIQDLIMDFSNIFPQLLILVFSLVIIFFVQWQLATFLVFAFSVYIFITIKLTKKLMASQKKFRELVNKQYGKVYDRLYNPFLVKNFGMEEEEKKNISNLFLKILPAQRDSSKKYNRISFYQGLIYSLSFVIILSYAIFSLRNGQITEGEFIMFFGYIGLVFSPLYRLTEYYKSFKKASVSIKKIVKFESLMPEAMKHGNKTLKEVKGEIKFSNVEFEYIKNKPILKGINLRIKSGQSVALVGQSGVGKSTLSELILGYYKPSKGNIFLDGVNLSELKLQWLREQIAIVPQDLSVFNDTLMKNIKYANPKASYQDVVRAAKAAGAHNFIMALPKKYESLVGEKGIRLSMGQKQRITLTMAFLKNPKILILDEPTSALDAESERIVQEGIKKLIKGRTTIIIAHRFSTVKHTDEIIVLDKKKIAEQGNHQELMKKKGKYYQLYNLQMGLD